ncbi:hypothetical protein CLCR_11032 [Cladophialophora carrionii]|uniref:Uncharacterized protein n=1 Tax=Cladophialophora carrionii TaxID=86049 RepID=A0A1C1CZX8_9EURO|nr:hypothetical protein CLCR_11032 [Cladophialophora carrionii]
MSTTITKDKETENSLEMATNCGQQFEPSSLPPPYVSPIPIPARRPTISTRHNDFSRHPRSRGEPVGDDNGELGRGEEKEDDADDNHESQAFDTKDSYQDSGDKECEYVGVFRMDK